jgi:hypothetical protein
LKLKIMFGRELQMIWICPFQEKEMEGGEGRSLTQWPMEGSIALWPLEGSIAWWWAMEGSIA